VGGHGVRGYANLRWLTTSRNGSERQRSTGYQTVVDAPQALSLVREPQPNVERYDTLLDKDLRHAS